MKCGHNNFHERVRFHLNHGLKKNRRCQQNCEFFSIARSKFATMLKPPMFTQICKSNGALKDYVILPPQIFTHEIHYNCV